MAFVNRNFAQVLNDGAAIDYAPVVFAPNPHPPTEEEYNAHGYYRVNIQPPNPPAGKVVAHKRFAVVNNECVAVYTYADPPPAPSRTFSKLRLYAALSSAGLWDALVAWLQSQTYEGVNAWTAFSLAQELTDAHPMFRQWFSAAKTALGVSDEQSEEILAACVTEGVAS